MKWTSAWMRPCTLQVSPSPSAALAVLLLTPALHVQPCSPSNHFPTAYSYFTESNKPFQVLLQPLVKVRQLTTPVPLPALHALSCSSKQRCSSHYQDTLDHLLSPFIT